MTRNWKSHAPRPHPASIRQRPHHLMLRFALGGHFVIAGSMTLGNFTAFNSYLALLIFPILVIGFMSNVIAQAQVGPAAGTGARHRAGHPLGPLGRRTLDLLNARDERPSVLESVAKWNAPALEDAFAYLALSGAVVRSESEWTRLVPGRLAASRVTLLRAVHIDLQHIVALIADLVDLWRARIHIPGEQVRAHVIHRRAALGDRFGGALSAPA